MTPARTATKKTASPADNAMLAALPANCKPEILPRAALQPLKAGQVLYQPGHVNASLFFPVDAIVGLSLVLNEGGGTLVAVVGSEGFCGVRGLFDDGRAMLRAQVLVGGDAFRVPTGFFRETMERCEGLRLHIMKYREHVVSEAHQYVVCNAHHALEQRLARVLLEIASRQVADDIPLTQEILGEMLGVRREGISKAAGCLRAGGIIEYSRGHIRILDRGALEQAACECFAALNRLKAAD